MFSLWVNWKKANTKTLANKNENNIPMHNSSIVLHFKPLTSGNPSKQNAGSDATEIVGWEYNRNHCSEK